MSTPPDRQTALSRQIRHHLLATAALYEEQLARLEDDLESLSRRCGALLEERQQQVTQFVELQARLSSLQQRLHQIVEQRDALQKENQRLRQENSAMASDLDEQVDFANALTILEVDDG